MSRYRVLEVTELEKSFGGLRALDRITLHLDADEIVGLIGPNGAGKTALINTITGFYRATSGSIRLHGREISHLPMHQIGRLGVGRTFQNIRLLRRLTVLENVLAADKTLLRNPLRALAGLGRNRARDEALGWLERFQLADKADRMASTLSYGDARRLEISRAMAGNPDLLLLDEPAAGMNEAETQQLAEDIRAVRKFVKAIFLIEHDMDLIQDLSDRIIAMDYGRKLVEGTSREVLRHPEVLKAYLGETAAEPVG
ncbi:MAG: ABC transporter ATP-binding protein [Pseudorhodoplanes sp.]|uniref:ABC transporter ATP-binding protein n=1 Tax=Pseudorhodoplanes sp. TaxID=1934341 RepID=UPI003D12C0C7